MDKKEFQALGKEVADIIDSMTEAFEVVVDEYEGDTEDTNEERRVHDKDMEEKDETIDGLENKISELEEKLEEKDNN